MTIFMIAALVFATAYLFLQLWYTWYWKQTPQIDIDKVCQVPVSVIVVAHNEESNIESCILSIEGQDYPEELLELLIIDDRSVDKTASIARRYQSERIRVLRLADYPGFIHPPAFKKSGIDIGVHEARHECIVVTDADCTHHTFWLRSVVSAQSQLHAVFLTGPVQRLPVNNLLSHMQHWESLLLNIITGAGIEGKLHDLANGANMAFLKSAFHEVKGYAGNYHISSGDDMFLIEKMRKKFPDRIGYIKSPYAMVTTDVKNDWPSLMRQRLRWSGKNVHLKNKMINLIWGFVGIYHVLLISALALIAVNPGFLLYFLVLLLTKWIADMVVFSVAEKFFKTRLFLTGFIILQFIYAYFILRLGWNLMLKRKGDW